MAKPLLLLGAGGHAKVIVDAIESSTDAKILGVLDACASEREFLGYPILGTDEELLKFSPREVDIFVSLGFIKSAKKRNELIDFAKSRGFSSPNIVSREAVVSKRAQLGEGNIIMPSAVVNAYAKIGNFCIINTSSIIEHDAAIGDGVHISTNAVINGGSCVGASSFIGSSAIIGNNIEVGASSVISAGEVVLKDVPESTFFKSRSRESFDA
jgi:sugar O-acyltransferase (sialic acid O-acetyltransferase NeuD family)